MSRPMWETVVETDFAVPIDRPLNDLTTELVEMLGTTDPELRDEIAYRVLATWICRGVYDDLLATLGDSIARGMQVGLGDDGTDTVFRRSFAALILTGCLERDNAARLLPKELFLQWSDRGISWLLREQDLRGLVPDKGSAHAVAHGADLLRAIAASHHSGADEAEVVLGVIAERLQRPTRHLLVDGEVDRLAAAALTVVYRNLVSADVLDAWASRLGDGLEATEGRTDVPTPAARNTSGFIRAVYVHLGAGIRPPMPHPDDQEMFDRVPAHRADLLLALLAQVPRSAPWLYARRS